MTKYKNVMEILVEEQFEKLDGSLGCCTCEVCRNDIISLALNHLPPKYVVTREGELISKLDQFGPQYATDIVAALAKAAEQVGARPRH